MAKSTLTRDSEKGRALMTASCARRTLAAATSFIAEVIFLESSRTRCGRASPSGTRSGPVNGAREGAGDGDGNLRSGSGAWFIHSLRQIPRGARTPERADARGSSVGTERRASDRGDDRRRNDVFLVVGTRARQSPRGRGRVARSGYPSHARLDPEMAPIACVSDAGPRTVRDVLGVTTTRGSPRRVNAHVAMVRGASVASLGFVAARGGVVRGVDAYEGGAAASNLLGRHRGDAGALEGGLGGADEGGLAAAMDMVRAAIAKSGE